MGMNPFSSDGDQCKGRFGMVEDEQGNRTKGIEMKCPGHDADRIVVTGDKEEAQGKAKNFLEQEGYSAKIRDDT